MNQYALEIRVDHMDGKISKLKDRNIEITQEEEARELRFVKVKKSYENYPTPLRKPTHK